MGEDWFERTAPVRAHPRLEGLGRDAAEAERVAALAHDLAAWLLGAPRAELGAMGRVVSALAGPLLRDTRALCHGLPLLAVEAGARATELIWPLLADPVVDADPPDDAEARAPEGDGEGTPAEGAEGDDPSWTAFAELPEGGDPDVDALLRGLRDPEEAARRLEPAGEAAWSGAKDGEALARTLEGLLPGVGWGAAPGTLQRSLLADLQALAELLERLPELRALADRLGRLEAEVAREGVEVGGSEEVTGVHLSGDAQGALASELALLADPDTEDLFYARLVERRLLAVELTGAGLGGISLPDARGPVLACIDTSGSMIGAPERLAKAVVLAVARRVLPEGRALHVLLFGSRGEGTEIRLQRGQAGLAPMLAFLAQGFQGGTDFDTPLLRALDLLDERELDRADVLVVTDGLAQATLEVVAAVERARERRGVRVLSLVIGPHPLDGVLPFSDEVWGMEAGGGGAIVRRATRGGPPPGAPRSRR